MRFFEFLGVSKGLRGVKRVQISIFFQDESNGTHQARIGSLFLPQKPVFRSKNAFFEFLGVSRGLRGINRVQISIFFQDESNGTHQARISPDRSTFSAQKTGF